MAIASVFICLIETALNQLFPLLDGEKHPLSGGYRGTLSDIAV